jgi:hypothetical protein
MLRAFAVPFPPHQIGRQRNWESEFRGAEERARREQLVREIGNEVLIDLIVGWVDREGPAGACREPVEAVAARQAVRAAV